MNNFRCVARVWRWIRVAVAAAVVLTGAAVAVWTPARVLAQESPKNADATSEARRSEALQRATDEAATALRDAATAAEAAVEEVREKADRIRAEAENRTVRRMEIDEQKGNDDAPPVVEEPAPRPRRGGRGGRNREIVEIGKPVHIKAGETARNVVVIFNNATIDGTVRDDVVVVGGNLTVNGTVEQNTVCILGRFVVGPNAEIKGDAVSVGGGFDRAAESSIRGQAVSVPIPGLEELNVSFPDWISNSFRELMMKARPLSLKVGWIWWIYGSLLLAQLLAVVVIPNAVRASATALEEQPAASFLLGLAAFPLAFFVALLLAMTGVGVLLWPFLLATLLFSGLVGKSAAKMQLGAAIARSMDLAFLDGPVGRFCVGAVIITVFYLMWYVGIIVWMVVSLWAVGGALLALFSRFGRELPGKSSPRPPRGPGGFSMGNQPAFAMAGAGATSMPGSSGGVGGAPGEPGSSGATLHSVIGDPGSSGGANASSVGSSSTPQGGAFGSGGALGTAVGGGVGGGGKDFPPLAPGGLDPISDLDLPRASFWRRLASAAIDVILLVALTSWAYPFGLLFWVAYFAGMWVWRGTSLGGIICGLRVVRVDGRKVDFATAIVRSLGAIFGVMVCFLGYIWAAWDEQGQAWHDKIAGTQLVVTPVNQSII